MSPEELDEARAKEAQRLWESGQESGSSSWVVAARLAREGWTPPEPVDPDVLAFHAWRMEQLSYVEASEGSMTAKAFLAGARMAREQAKPLAQYLQDRADRDDAEADRILAKYRGERDD